MYLCNVNKVDDDIGPITIHFPLSQHSFILNAQKDNKMIKALLQHFIIFPKCKIC